jgi:glycosyltransferase involved in cell wall biosynthesis
MQNRTVTIAIPTYDDNNGGVENLNHLFKSIAAQDYPNIDVVVSDHSEISTIKELCESFSQVLNIKYIKNNEDRGYWGSNLNTALLNSSGDLLKPMLQDDYFFNDSAISTIVNNFEETNFKWAICAGVHTQDRNSFYNPVFPRYTEDIHRGNNKLGGPSGLVICKLPGQLYFSSNLNWMGDCDYYKRSFKRHGLPTIIEDTCVVYKQWAGQMTNTITDKQKQEEVAYVIAKFSTPYE